MGEEPKGLRRIKQTQDRDFLMDFAPSVSTGEFFCSIKGVLGEDFRTLRLQSLTEEIKDFDPRATKEDVIEAFQRSAAEGDSIDCKVLRPGLLGMQVAVVACSV